MGGIEIGPAGALVFINLVGFEVDDDDAFFGFKQAVDDAADDNGFVFIVGMKVGGGINLVGGQSKSEGPFALEGGAVLEQASAQGISEKSGDVG